MDTFEYYRDNKFESHYEKIIASLRTALKSSTQAENIILPEFNLPDVLGLAIRESQSLTLVD